LQAVLKTPAEFNYEAASEKCKSILNKVAGEKRTILSESESKKVLESYAIPISQTLPAKTADEAAKLAKEMGFPVVVKIHSETITHKSDVGGVILNVKSEDEVRDAYKTIHDNVAKIRPDTLEKDFLGVTIQPMLDINNGVELLLGAINDVQFGPVIPFGTGGKLVEIYKDSALALPPLNTITARRLVMKTKIYKALLGVRGMKPVDLDKLDDILIKFSYLLQNHPEIKELDINPLFASGERICAIDARVVLFGEGEKITRASIAPYPSQYNTDKLRVLKREDCELFAKWLVESDRDAMKCFLCTEKLPEDLNEHIYSVKLLYPEFDNAITIAACANNSINGLVRVTRLDKSSVMSSYAIPKDSIDSVADDLIAAAANIAKGEKYSAIKAYFPDFSESAKLLRAKLVAAGYKEQDGYLTLSL